MMLPHSLPVLKRSDSELYFKVNGVMKLADKYHISFLRDLIVGHTEQDWPKTLADFVRLRKDMKVVMTPAKPTCTSLQRPRFPFMIEAFPEPASSIRLAVDYDIPSILPAAFYFLSTLDPQHNNWKRGQELCDSRGLSMSIFEWNARWYLLNDSEMLRYYRGKERLIKELMSIGNVFRIRHEHCDAKWSAEVVSEMDEELPPCAPVVNQIMLRQEMRHGLGLLDPKTFALHPDPIGVLLDLENFAGDWDLCFHCKLEVMDNVFRRAQRIWDELPRTFGVTQAQKGRFGSYWSRHGAEHIWVTRYFHLASHRIVPRDLVPTFPFYLYIYAAYHDAIANFDSFM